MRMVNQANLKSNPVSPSSSFFLKLFIQIQWWMNLGKEKKIIALWIFSCGITAHVIYLDV